MAGRPDVAWVARLLPGDTVAVVDRITEREIWRGRVTGRTPRQRKIGVRHISEPAGPITHFREDGWQVRTAGYGARYLAAPVKETT